MTEAEIMKLAVFEGAFILFTVACAALNLWGLFAGLALLCLLAPLWILVLLSTPTSLKGDSHD